MLVIQDQNNVIPVALAVLLHVVLFGSLFVVLDFGRHAQIPMPLVINATLVTENSVVIPPKPDTREQDRIAAEERKRLEDARRERDRIQQQREVEQRRIAAQENQRKEAEAEAERRRVEAERQRQAEVERQRQENERLRREADDAARQKELDDESERVTAMTANAKAAYMFAIQQTIQRNWVRPASAEVGLECTLHVRQLPGGEVVDVSFGACNGDETVKRSIESAVHKASPLPAPRDPSVFDRDLRLTFRPEE